ncbi:hypothetical protein EV122DRAFT_272763 [Schizophyllum commune]
MSDTEEYSGRGRGRKAKRQKTRRTPAPALEPTPPPVRTGLKLKLRLPTTRQTISVAPLINLTDDVDEEEIGFEDVLDVYLPSWLNERSILLASTTEKDVYDRTVRPPTRSEAFNILGRSDQSSAAKIVARKLILDVKGKRRDTEHPSTTGPIPPPATQADPTVIDGLYSIRTTPYERTLQSRVIGANPGFTVPKVCFEIDWHTQGPWTEVMSDIKEHYSLRCLIAEPPATEDAAPLIYTCLAAEHLPQVHDLLQRTFWDGIDVSDSLEYSPERCTVVVLYKRVVVGVAIMSSPQETYITYLAVRSGWEGCQIATRMIYHLVSLNPYKDITLHVSANNPAMLLYNRVGFKAEEFVLGFYDEFLPKDARASKNAFRLRLRHR